MGRFGHFLLGFVAGSVSLHYLLAESTGAFWVIALVSICLAAELLYAFRSFDKWVARLLLPNRSPAED